MAITGVWHKINDNEFQCVSCGAVYVPSVTVLFCHAPQCPTPIHPFDSDIIPVLPTMSDPRLVRPMQGLFMDKDRPRKEKR